MNMAPSIPWILLITASLCCTGGEVYDLSDCTHTVIDSSYHVNCSNRNLSSVPKNLPMNTTCLDLSGNEITALSKNSFTGLTLLVTLLLNSNHLCDLHPITFNGLSNLWTLNLQNNNLNFSVLQQDVFGPLVNLQELYLGKNPLIVNGSYYPENMFRSLSSLRVLGIDTERNSVFGQRFSQLKKLQHLNMNSLDNNCGLEIITNNTFKHFQDLSLKRLDMSHCSVLYLLEKLAFQYFPKLEILSLRSTGNIPIRMVTQALTGFAGKSMKSIDMSGVYIKNRAVADLSDLELTADVMGPLLDVCLESLDIRNNGLLYADMTVLRGRRLIRCLVRFDISGNNFLGGSILWMDMYLFEKLQYLNIETANDCQVGPNQSLKKNSAVSFNVTVTLPPNLIEVNMKGTPSLQYLLHEWNVYFKQAKNLRQLTLSYAGIIGTITHKVFGLDNLEILDMSGNDFAGVISSFFDTFPSLHKLSLRYANLERYNQFQELFSKLKHLTLLDLTGNKISQFPSNAFDTILHISEISFSDNALSVIPINLKSTPYLTRLDMSKNLLTYVPGHQRELLDRMSKDRIITLSLKGNSLSCGCNTLDFIKWLAQTKVKLDNHGVYLCVDENGVLTNTSHVLQTYHQFWRQCIGTSSLFISIIIWVNLLLTLAIGWIVGNHWLAIKPFFFRLIGVKPLLRQDFRFDVYIGHCEQDYSFACLSLGLVLEDAFGLRTFLRDRDSVPGVDVSTEVIRGVRSSWINLILLTAGFQTDEWMTYIMEQAVYETRSMPRRLVLVAVGDVDIGLFPECVLRSVKNDNVLVCDDFFKVIDQLEEIYKLIM